MVNKIKIKKISKKKLQKIYNKKFQDLVNHPIDERQDGYGAYLREALKLLD